MAKKLQVINQERCTGCRICESVCSTLNYNSPYESAVRINTTAFGENINKIRVCYSCSDAPCVLACPTGYLIKREGGGVTVNKKMECISCGNCVEYCRYSYLKLTSDKKPLICKQCGVCVNNCPNDCFIMVETDD